jgi:5-formyltetrahydrofolate cyclo-ligase
MTPTSAKTAAVRAKARLRAEALERRRSTPAEIRQAFAERLAREGVSLAKLWRAKIVSAFHPMRDEPDTMPLLAALAAERFLTALPATRRRREPLVFRLWKPGDRILRGAMDIAEPAPESPEVEPDLLFVPLAAFDRLGARIGFGAGFYDRTLAGLRARGSIHAVGVAFSTSEVESVPAEPHDEPLDFILTENEWIDARGSP